MQNPTTFDVIVPAASIDPVNLELIFNYANTTSYSLVDFALIQNSSARLRFSYDSTHPTGRKSVRDFFISTITEICK